MRSFVLVVFVACWASTAASTHAAGRVLVGGYALTTTIAKPSHVVARGSLTIETYNASTGTITGHGLSQDAALTMTGSVHGSTVVMRVVNVYGVASDRGTIHADGTITGTITATGLGVHESGTWAMRPLQVDVAKTGLSLQHLGHQTTGVSWGVELTNRSRTQDAVGVDVRVIGIGPNGKPIADYGAVGLGVPTIHVIPAGATIVLADGVNMLGYVKVARLRVDVVVAAMRPRGLKLPPVSDVRVDRQSKRITATVRNPYAHAVSPYDLDATVVLYDRAGRILGGTNTGSVDLAANHAIKPGGRADVEASIPDEVPADRVAAAKITILPR